VATRTEELFPASFWDAGDALDVCKQRSYFVIFDVLTGEVLMDEVEIEEILKYEGVEFVDMYTIPK
jgi:soluble calcium-activated nucleotidase 1